jgi:hypothetical protein
MELIDEYFKKGTPDKKFKKLKQYARMHKKSPKAIL